MTGVSFDRDFLDRCDFSSCDLLHSDFADCSLRHADFSDASLRGTRFNKCNLLGATFSGADLHQVSFHDCDVTDADLSQADGLVSEEQFEQCVGLDRATLPDDFIWINDNYLDEEEEQDLSSERIETSDREESDEFIEIDGQTRKVPRIPRRVPAPIETAWVDGKLTVRTEGTDSNLSATIIEATIGSLVVECNEFVRELRGTNVDQRIIDRLERVTEDIPQTAVAFSERIFRIWHQFRPVFEYSKIVGSEQGDYVRARFISLESDLRGILNSFPLWRSYEYEATRLQMPETFSIERMKITQGEIISSLKKFPNAIDSSVPTSLNEIDDPGYRFGSGVYLRSNVYDFAASFANVLSRLMRRVIDEIARGGSEGVREGTKKLVAAIMLSGGATMIWLVANGLGLFPWLTAAWQFVRNVIGL